MVISRLKYQISRMRQARLNQMLTPERLYAGDTFIVEYPKSGVTWLTVLLANAFLAQYKLGEKATFCSVRRFIPDLHASRAVAPRLSSGGVGFYKSHALFNPNYAATIYLVRHPLAVMRSYHKFRSVIDPKTSKNFVAFLNDHTFGLPAWRRHVQSWLMTPRDTSQRQLHLVRYEDLISDTAHVLSELSTNFGWGLSSESMEEAVGRSTREKMRRQEEVYRSHNPGHVLEFVGDSQFSENYEAETYVMQHCVSELKKLGYA